MEKPTQPQTKDEVSLLIVTERRHQHHFVIIPIFSVAVFPTTKWI